MIKYLLERELQLDIERVQDRQTAKGILKMWLHDKRYFDSGHRLQ